MSIPTLRLPRLGCSISGCRSGSTWMPPMLRKPRWVSPRSGCSTLMTSAPQSARMAPAAGTNVNCATSRTRKPSITLTNFSLPPWNLLRVERHRKRVCRPEGLTVDMWVLIGNEIHVGHPAQQAFQRDPRLHAGEVKTQAGVLTGRERDVRHVFAEDVEFPRAVPPLLVAIGRADAQINRRPRGNL